MLQFKANFSRLVYCMFLSNAVKVQQYALHCIKCPELRSKTVWNWFAHFKHGRQTNEHVRHGLKRSWISLGTCRWECVRLTAAMLAKCRPDRSSEQKNRCRETEEEEEEKKEGWKLKSGTRAMFHQSDQFHVSGCWNVGVRPMLFSHKTLLSFCFLPPPPIFF